MPYPVDPASLEGDELDQWYRRLPQEIEDERQAAEAQRYRSFFGADRDGAPSLDGAATPQARMVDPGFGQPMPPNDIDPQFARPAPRSDIDPGFTWYPTGPNRWRGERISDPIQSQSAESIGSSPDASGYLGGNAAHGTNGAYLVPVGNPATPRLRREHERKTGQPWPRDPVTGRNYDVSHIVAKADGGTDTVDNIRPQHPVEHRAEHMRNKDFQRWGARSRVPRGVNGVLGEVLGPLSIIPDITGILSGRIRTDSVDNFMSDMFGFPSQEDQRKASKELIAMGPAADPGQTGFA